MMILINSIRQGPKNLPDAVSGAENKDRITNSEEQSLVDDEVAETAISTSPENEEQVLSLPDQEQIDKLANP